MSVGKGNVQVVNIYFLAMFYWPWGQGDRCQGSTNPTLGPRRGFSFELNFSQHRTERGIGGRFLDCNEGFNDWGGRGYDVFVPGKVTKTAPFGERPT